MKSTRIAFLLGVSLQRIEEEALVTIAGATLNGLVEGALCPGLREKTPSSFA